MHPRLKLAVMYNSSLHCECDFFSSWPSTTTKKLIACFSLCLPLARSPRYCTYCACAGSHTRIPTCTCTRHQLRIRNPSFILFLSISMQLKCLLCQHVLHNTASKFYFMSSICFFKSSVPYPITKMQAMGCCRGYIKSVRILSIPLIL